MKSAPDKPRIIQETVKDRHTSHWDQDMLSHAELEALMCMNNENANTTTGASDAANPHKPAARDPDTLPSSD